MSRKWFAGAVAALALVVGGGGGASVARADTIYADYNASASASLGSGAYVYDLVIAGGTEIRDLAGANNNAYVTIFDFAGLVGSPTVTIAADIAADGFTAVASTSNLGRTPSGLTPSADSADVANVTVDFFNANASKVFTRSVEHTIARLVLWSTYTDRVELWDNVASFDYRTSFGTLKQNRTLTDTTVPVASLVTVPVPAAVWGGMALFGAIGAARLRRRAAERD